MSRAVWRSYTAKTEDSFVKLQTAKIGISEIGFALRNCPGLVGFGWKMQVQTQNIMVEIFKVK